MKSFHLAGSPMFTSMRNFGPSLAAVVVYAAVVAVLVRISLEKNDGQFVYALDDAYIHMAMAKNAALHGVWGVTREGFSSSTSSPLWTGLLTGGYRLLGVNEWLPLVLNCVCGLAALCCGGRFLEPWITPCCDSAFWRPRRPRLRSLRTTALHLTFAQLGWFYRYEAYLVWFGVLSLATFLCRKTTPAAESTRRPVTGGAAIFARPKR